MRCPACEDISVAVSDATSAIAVRHEITRDVHRGDSDNTILTSLEDTYGASILLSPPTTGPQPISIAWCPVTPLSSQ